MLERARPRRRAARHRPGARVRSRRARPAFPGPLRLPPRPQPQRAARRCRRSTSRSIDGDHNWYTVYNELRLLRDGRRAAGATAPGADPARRLLAVRAPRPLLRPGRRSPRSSASRTRRRGMRPGRKQLLPRRRHEHHARTTPIDGGRAPQRRDDRARRLHRRARPAVAPARASRSTSGSRSSSRNALLDDHPELRRAARPARERRRASDELLELSEQIRLDGDRLRAQHLLRVRDEQLARANDRYLDAARAARCSTSTTSRTRSGSSTCCDCIEPAAARPTPSTLRDPDAAACARSAGGSRQARAGRAARRRRRRHGVLPVHRRWADSSSTSSTRRCDIVRDERVAGDLVECGTGRGGGGDLHARLPRGARDRRPRRCGWPTGSGRRPTRRRLPTTARAGGVDDLLADLNQVRDGVRALRPARRAGALPAGRLRRRRCPTRRSGRSRCSASARRPAPSGATCSSSCTTALAVGGFVIVDDATRIRRVATRSKRSAPAAGSRARSSASAGRRLAWRKDRRRRRAPTDGADAPARASAPTAPPLAPPAPADANDLSVVVVFYNMRREAARTLHSLSPRVPAGHRRSRLRGHRRRERLGARQRLGEEFVRSFGPEFRYLDLGDARDAVADRRAQPRASRAARGRRSRS